MPDQTNQQHWETIYQTKQPDQVSWTQTVPTTSLGFIRQFSLPKSARIIDIGGGDSTLVDYLLDAGYEQLTVLDISKAALNRAKNRLGHRAELVQWIVSDITDYAPTQPFDLWHDRAAFHFLTTPDQISRYLTIARDGVQPDGYVTIGTFSENGPDKCSGLPIRQYSEQTLSTVLAQNFKKLTCVTEDHITPFQTIQNFLFCSFQRLAMPDPVKANRLFNGDR